MAGSDITHSVLKRSEYFAGKIYRGTYKLKKKEWIHQHALKESTLLHASRPMMGYISEVVRTGMIKGIKSMVDSHPERHF